MTGRHHPRTGIPLAVRLALPGLLLVVGAVVTGGMMIGNSLTVDTPAREELPAGVFQQGEVPPPPVFSEPAQPQDPPPDPATAEPLETYDLDPGWRGPAAVRMPRSQPPAVQPVPIEQTQRPSEQVVIPASTLQTPQVTEDVLVVPETPDGGVEQAQDEPTADGGAVEQDVTGATGETAVDPGEQETGNAVTDGATDTTTPETSADTSAEGIAP